MMHVPRTRWLSHACSRAPLLTCCLRVKWPRTQPGSYNTVTDQRSTGSLGEGESRVYSMPGREAFVKAAKSDVRSPGPIYHPSLDGRCLTPTAVGPMGAQTSQYSFQRSKRFEPLPRGQLGPGSYAKASDSTRVGGTLIGDAPKWGFGTSAQRDSSAKGSRFISKEHSFKSNCASAHSVAALVLALMLPCEPSCAVLELTRVLALMRVLALILPADLVSRLLQPARGARSGPADAVSSPGPLLYKMEDGLGSTTTGTGITNSPKYSFRPKLDTYQPSGTGGDGPVGMEPEPGPGTYHPQPVAFGIQAQSSRNSMSAYSFSTGTRPSPMMPKKMQYMGKKFEGSMRGVYAPGPKYDIKSSCGPTQNPMHKLKPSYSFGGESRFAY